MECEHNVDKATLQHLVLQLSNILNFIYMYIYLVMQSAHFVSSALCRIPPPQSA
jgi:hypothetical protein